MESNITRLECPKSKENKSFTVIDFIHFANPMYLNGGWVSISDKTFIRPSGSDIRLKIIKAYNIPFSPQKHFYRNKHDKLWFTLVFPGLPNDCSHFDFIEGYSSKNNFNFYTVPIQEILNGPLTIIHHNNLFN